MKFLVDMPASPNSLNGLMKKDMMLFTPRILAYIKQRTEKYLKKQGNTIGLLSLLTLISQLLAISHAKDPGIILFRGGNYNEKEMCNLLKRVLDNVKEEKIVDSIIVVDKTRIRRCPLPIE